MDLSFTYDMDPEYRYRFLKTFTQTTPAGLEKIHFRNKIYQDTDYDAIPDVITETLTVNGKSASVENRPRDGLKTATSSAGRIQTIVYDPDTLLPTRLSTPGLFDTLYTYNDAGRITSVSTHTRQNIFSYDSKGFLESFTNAENQTTRYAYDDLGRILGVARPDGSSINYSYDANGNLAVLTVPTAIDHEFTYNGVNLQSAYMTPVSGSYRYLYDADRQLIRIELPSGNQIDAVYDKTRLIQLNTPNTSIDYTYLCDTQLQSTSRAEEKIVYDYDGILLTAATNSGALNQTITFEYDDDFQLIALFYAGDMETYTYDADGLLAGTGTFSIARHAENGLPEQVFNETVSLSRTFNGYGEIQEERTRVGDKFIDAWQLTRNDSGRIIEKSETVAGVTSRFVYTYDPIGRVTSVARNGILSEAYQYDANGARSYEMNLHKNVPGRYYTYSVEDHLLSAGEVSYAYSPDGFLMKKTAGTKETYFHYSALGELRRVVLPDETVIEYLYDPLCRRIAKKKNGEIVEKYLWQGLTRLLAVYDGSDRLIMRFQYANARMPTAMTMNGVHYYLCYDPIGTLRAIADETGHVLKRIESDTFGSIISDTNPDFSVPIGFAGGLVDPDTGLIKFGHRDYDPDTGRWTAKDPLFFAGGDTDLYGYCLNDPVNLVDPLGLEVLGPGIYENYHFINNIRYSHTNLKGSILFTDYSTKIHEAKTGLFSSTKTNLGVSTSLLGGGAQFVFDVNDSHGIKGLGELSFSFGFGRYLGLTIFPELEQISINVGLGFSPPISVSTQIDTIDHSCN
jgi:RHS repeat-associated protein